MEPIVPESRHVLEPTDRIGNISFCRHPLDSVCQTFPFAPGPMRSYQAIQGLMFTNTLDECMPGCLVAPALDAKRLKTRCEHNRCQHRHPSFKEVYERLSVALLNCNKISVGRRPWKYAALCGFPLMKHMAPNRFRVAGRQGGVLVVDCRHVEASVARV